MAHGSSCPPAPDRPPPRPPQVRLTDAGHRAPVNLLARIEQGLTDVLDGDIGYGGRITKNLPPTQRICPSGAKLKRSVERLGFFRGRR